MLAQTPDVSKPETDCERPVPLLLDRAQPVRAGNVDRQNFQSVTLRIFNESKWLIKTHRLIVENRGRECCQVIAFQISAGIRNQGKTGRVRFGKTVKRKRTDGQYDLFLRLSRDPVLSQPLSQFYFNRFHASF